jgi:hypothetical protein
MDLNEVQFEVFETTQEGYFKPIFMVGRCIKPKLGNQIPPYSKRGNIDSATLNRSR